MSPALDPRPRSARVRLGIGAGLVLLLLAGGVAAAAAALTPGGATVELAASGAPGEEASSSAGSSDAGSAGGSGAGDGSEVDAAGSDTGTAELYVHVTGQVAHPGLYRVAPDSRVIDVVGAAGGLTPEADAAAINLARRVDDGEQLHVPAVGEAPAAGGSAGGASAGGGSTGGSGGVAAGGIVNLNSADQAQLETLPRIGPALAQRILDWREQNGRFASVDDLREVSGIGEKTFAQLEPLVTV
ncbi:ComEA family DNA-binding protein [Schumannella sp. 10F1B-5-1]|uniref:ComEA family DNA-binding protein n=1 Tax=Schumannella sp. 10F1B-5-1 TaxID=2590780 RepID=UPI001131068C|nr:ComEA family DNA-binding protein [Schumannella sp. 10F1B-5-1]TPW70202.1 ComEA family DNA-binding protein [Schumannella sp. 10F1B-5-1]